MELLPAGFWWCWGSPRVLNIPNHNSCISLGGAMGTSIWALNNGPGKWLLWMVSPKPYPWSWSNVGGHWGVMPVPWLELTMFGFPYMFQRPKMSSGLLRTDELLAVWRRALMWSRQVVNDCSIWSTQAKTCPTVWMRMLMWGVLGESDLVGWPLDVVWATNATEAAGVGERLTVGILTNTITCESVQYNGEEAPLTFHGWFLARLTGSGSLPFPLLWLNLCVSITWLLMTYLASWPCPSHCFHPDKLFNLWPGVQKQIQGAAETIKSSRLEVCKSLSFPPIEMAEGALDLSGVASITCTTRPPVAGYWVCDTVDALCIWFVSQWIFEVMNGRVSIVINSGRFQSLCHFVGIIIPIPHIVVLPFDSFAPGCIVIFQILIWCYNRFWFDFVEALDHLARWPDSLPVLAQPCLGTTHWIVSLKINWTFNGILTLTLSDTIESCWKVV